MNLTLKQSISVAILLLGIAGIVLLLFSAHSYRQLAYENEQAALSEMVGLKMQDLLAELDRRSKEMGSNLQQEVKLRTALNDRDPVALRQLLNDQFFQYYTTAEILKIARIYVYDKNFTMLAHSTEGFLTLDHGIELCPEVLERAKPRQGPERVKTIAVLCEYQGHGYYSVLVPIGGLIPSGYLVITTDPAFSMKPAEMDMGNPILIRHPNADVAYQSKQWPHYSEMDNYLYADYELKDLAGKKLIGMAIVRDITHFRQSLTDRMWMIMILALCLITPTMLAVWFLLKRAFTPLEKLQQASVVLSEGKYITIEGSNFPEINTLVNSFNTMSGNIASLVEKLEVENIQRRRIQDQLEDSKHQLEFARDEALKATQVKSSFLANMSHEIRTPLTAIVGFSKMLQKPNLAEDKKNKTIRTVVKNSEHLLSIVNDILDISKIEAGKLEIVKHQFSLFQFMHEISNVVVDGINEKGLQFTIDYLFPVPEQIITDEVRLKQIMINLLSNAKKFTANGHITVHVGYNTQSNLLEFDVEDSGIGLKEDQIRRIFLAFEQADSSTTKKYGGTGLGLSITQQLVQKLGGEIHVESEINKGSHFKFSIFPGELRELKLVAEMQELFLDSHKSEFEPDSVSVAGTILLVEDTVDNQELISSYLTDMGAKVTLANNGKEAVENCVNQQFDLILMDMQMPIMGGVEAIELLRHRGYAGPIAMLTANALEEDRNRCAKAGCNDFLVKPLHVGNLCRVVEKYLPTQPSKDLGKLNHQADSIKETKAIISSLLGKSPKYDKLVKKFVEQLPQFLADLTQANNLKDRDKLLHEAHRLKGVGGNYGFASIHQLCTELEQELKQNNFSTVDDYLAKLHSTVDGIRKGTDSYFSSLNKSA